MLFYGFDQIIENPFSVLRVWEGGLSFHGGLIGILFSFYMFCKKTNLSFFEFSDHIALSFPLGLGIVRIGNFLGGELLGRPTDLPWGIIFGATHYNSLDIHLKFIRLSQRDRYCFL